MSEAKEASDSIEKSGENNVIRFDELGPIIVNTDGTLQRIPNWNEMSENERAKALRLIAARNKKRLEKLREDDAISNGAPKAANETESSPKPLAIEFR
jgi:predicted Fe-S protein YdhL (DUF1289 family)